MSDLALAALRKATVFAYMRTSMVHGWPDDTGDFPAPKGPLNDAAIKNALELRAAYTALAAGTSMATAGAQTSMAMIGEDLLRDARRAYQVLLSVRATWLGLCAEYGNSEGVLRHVSDSPQEFVDIYADTLGVTYATAAQMLHEDHLVTYAAGSCDHTPS